MGRPPKNNCEYFPHRAEMRNHRKIKALRNKLGITAYAIWNMLLEYLTDMDGNEFENSESEHELMAGDFGVSVTEISDVLNYCIKLDLLFEKNGFIYSETLNDNLAPVYEKRGRAKELSKQQLRKNGKFVTETTVSTAVSVTEIPQSKVDNIKVKGIKIFTPPSETEVSDYFFENGFKREAGIKAYKYYETANWKDSRGNKVKNWKQKMQGIWFKDENIELVKVNTNGERVYNAEELDFMKIKTY